MCSLLIPKNSYPASNGALAQIHIQRRSGLVAMTKFVRKIKMEFHTAWGQKTIHMEMVSCLDSNCAQAHNQIQL
jgi:hypothetical protein